MPRISVSTVVKLLIASLVVGFFLAWFNVSPQALLRSMLGEARDMFDWAAGQLGWAFSYILLGAVIVVPIWFVFYLIKAVKGRK